jgi:ankyrin repeat protein
MTLKQIQQIALVTPLLWAANDRHEDVVKQLLSRGGVATDRKNPCQHSLPRYTAKFRWDAVVKLLLDCDNADAD